MSYNIMRGWDWKRAREVIRRHEADVVCLQEIVEPAHPDRRATRPGVILDDVGRPHALEWLWYRPPRRVGNVTFVNGRIEATEVLQAPGSPPYGMASRVVVNGVRLTVANLHLSEMHGPAAVAFAVSEMFRLRESRHLTRRFERSPGPVVAAGDFNSFGYAPACWVMRRKWHDARRAGPSRALSTRPTYGLPFVIDHVFVRGPVRVVDYAVLPDPGSDHRAVLTTLEILTDA